MSWLTVTGLSPYDGRYELDLEAQPLTTREWGWMKRYAGYLPITLTENTFTDPEVISVLAIVAIRRKGTIQTTDVPDLWERLQDAPFGSLVGLETDPAEGEGDADGPPTGNSNWSSKSSTPSSQTGSENSGASPESYWQPAVGYFGVGPGEVGELTPMQLLDCALVFEQLFEAGALNG